jgi:Ca2+-binding RTX toxin-like protein
MAAQDGRDDLNTSAAEIALPSATPAAHAVDAADATTVQPLAQQDASLIHLDQFRGDPRFAGINGQGETVVVLDTGINLNHPFFGPDSDNNGLADRIVFSYDFTGTNSSNANDVNGHGSNVASIVGSQDATYTGMASGCNIIALKVLSNSGSGTFADVEEALQWVVANRAAYNIVSVNMSLGNGTNSNSPTPGTLLSDEIATLHNNNVAVVCASGNAYTPPGSTSGYQTQGVSFPSSDPNAWSIGAVWDRDTGGWSWSTGAKDFTTGPDRIISFSQRSTTMTAVFAPGGQIWGATADGDPHGAVWYQSGTSQASPHIAGLVADMQQLAVQISGHLMSADDLRATMVSSAAMIFDGDDENDNVVNTNTNYPRVDVEAWGIAILNKLFAGTASNDTLNGTVVSDTIHGQGGNDSLSGGGGTDTLFGGAGNDTLDGGQSADTMLGGIGNDIYVVDNAGDVVTENAGEGTDTVYASVHYQLTANVEGLNLQGSADLQAYGNALANVIAGNSGNNLLDGGAGADVVSGGAGNDVYFVDDIGDSVVENPASGNDVVFSTANYALPANVETLVLQGTADLQGYGNALANTLYGNAGNNLLDGGAGADAMMGGAGNDVYFVDDAGDAVFENPGEGADVVFSTAHYGLSADVETLVLQGSADLQGYGSGQANTLYGNAGNNLLDGGAGADIMLGRAGNDTYFVDNAGDQVVENAGEGTDAVFSTVSYALSPNVETLVLQGSANLNGSGNALNNSIYGNSGDNVLDGQGGGDVLTGNAGDDTFVFDVGQANGDTVVDFAGNGSAAGDLLEFVGYGAGASFTNIDAVHWQVNYDSGAAHEIIAFMNGAAIEPSDVVFV